MLQVFALVVLLLSFSVKSNEFSNAKLEVFDNSALELLQPNSQLEILADNIGWGEGPVWSTKLNALLFSDIANNKVLKWSKAKGLETYLFPSGHTPDGVNGKWRGSNGLLINSFGELVLAQQGARTFAKMTSPIENPAPNYQLLADSYFGKKLNSPNDLVEHSSGSLFFTDPPYGLPKFEQDPAIELSFFAVFRLDPAGQLTPVITNHVKPNGIAISTDNKSLLVTDSQPEINRIYRYDLSAVGEVANPRVFFDAKAFKSNGAGSVDGLKQHKAGYWFISMPGGIGVLSDSGKLIARFQVGQVCNVAFDDRQNFVYFTAPHTLYRLKLKS